METALSIKEAGVDGRIVASLGIHNITNYGGPEKKIIICADNDGPHARTNAVIDHVRDHLSAQDKSVVIIRPHQSGQDFNDVLKETGIGGVQGYVREHSLKIAELSGNAQFHAKREEIMQLSGHLEEKLQAFQQDPLDTEIKRALLSLAKTLHRDPDLMDGLRVLSPETAKQMETLIREQQSSRGMER